MPNVEIRCPNCGTSFRVGDGDHSPLSELRDGVHYLVPETLRNENVSSQDRVNARLELLKAAGVNVDHLRELLRGSDSNVRDIFADDDPILNEINEGGFLHNPELFRRWITAQTFRLLKDNNGWTHAVRSYYDLVYAYRQTKRELALLCKLKNKCPNDIRFQFFTLDDLKRIFIQIDTVNFCHNTSSAKQDFKDKVYACSDYQALYNLINITRFGFHKKDCKFLPRDWLNCFKGAGAYYTLQNIIRTHGLVLSNCEDMDSSLNYVQAVFDDIVGYEPCQRRWDIMLSVLTKAVKEQNFELTW